MSTHVGLHKEFAVTAFWFNQFEKRERKIKLFN